jgi:hypothetical protein
MEPDGVSMCNLWFGLSLYVVRDQAELDNYEKESSSHGRQEYTRDAPEAQAFWGQ